MLVARTGVAWACRRMGVLDGAEEVEGAIGRRGHKPHVETHCRTSN